MEIDRLLDDSRVILRFSGSSFNENHDVFSYPETFWVEFNAAIMMDLVQSQNPKQLDHPVYRQKYNHGTPDLKLELSDSQDLELVSQTWRISPRSIIDEPAIEFTVVVSGTYYSFGTKIKHLENLINKGRKQ